MAPKGLGQNSYPLQEKKMVLLIIFVSQMHGNFFSRSFKGLKREFKIRSNHQLESNPVRFNHIKNGKSENQF